MRLVLPRSSIALLAAGLWGSVALSPVTGLVPPLAQTAKAIVRSSSCSGFFLQSAATERRLASSALFSTSTQEVDIDKDAIKELKKLSVTNVDNEQVSFDKILSSNQDGTVLVFLRHLG